MFARALLRRSGRQLRQLHTMPEHPHKGTVAALLHQRPFQRVELPSMVSSITMMPSKWQATLRGCDHALHSAEGKPTPDHIRASAPEQYDADYKHLCKLCDFFHVPGPPHGATFFTTDLGGACKLRWERHTEAQTYTFTRPAVKGEQADPFAESNVALSVIPREWLAQLPGLALTCLHVAMLESRPAHTRDYEFASLSQHFHRDANVMGCTVDRGRFRVYSDWRTHGDGFGRMLVHGMPDDDAPNQRTAAGKALQRLLELDKYRALALLALPFAHKLTPRIEALGDELFTLTNAIGGDGGDGGGGAGGGAGGGDGEGAAALVTQQADQREFLDRLCSLEAEGLKHMSSSNFRFAATRAYAQIVDDRILFLQMERIEGLPSMATFIGQALHPTVRTCDTVGARLEQLRTQAAHTADLLRTRLTVEAQQQNIRELEQLQQNSRTQLLLQESVEGLSVVAITYYSTGVLGYLAKGAHTLGWLPLPVELTLGACVPLIGASVYLGLHRLKASVMGGKAH